MIVRFNVMLFTTTSLGTCIIDAEQTGYKHGFFARVCGIKTFGEHGQDLAANRRNSSFSKSRDTLREMHYQSAPYREDKTFRCVVDTIRDVIVDARPDSETYRERGRL